jgi:hypothetical protein
MEKKKSMQNEKQHTVGYAKICKKINPRHVIDSPKIR